MDVIQKDFDWFAEDFAPGDVDFDVAHEAGLDTDGGAHYFAHERSKRVSFDDAILFDHDPVPVVDADVFLRKIFDVIPERRHNYISEKLLEHFIIIN